MAFWDVERSVGNKFKPGDMIGLVTALFRSIFLIVPTIRPLFTHTAESAAPNDYISP